MIWPNRDPMGEEGGINLCSFCINDPVGAYDLYGLHGIPPGWGLNVPGKCDPQPFEAAVRRYVSACNAGDVPQAVDCLTICEAFFGNLGTLLLINCTDSCERCDLHNFGKLRPHVKKPPKNPAPTPKKPEDSKKKNPKEPKKPTNK